MFYRQEDNHQEQDQTNGGCFTGKKAGKVIIVTPERQILPQNAGKDLTAFHLPNQVQTTLTVVEEERDRFMTRLLNEEKARKTLEGQRALLHSTNLPLPNLGFWSPGFSLLQTTSTHFPTEQHQELEHELATLKRERGHVENQLKVLQQKNEIMVEMYQQKENALQQ